MTCNQSARIDEGVPSDLIPGCNHTELFTDFCPIFGHFVSSGTERLQQLINNISNDEWERAKQLGQE